MSATLNKAELLPGRRVTRNEYGIAIEAERVYQVLRPLGAAEFNYTEVTGLPAKLSAHPVHSHLLVTGYEEQEDSGIRWLVTVKYGAIEAKGTGDLSRVVSRSGNTVEGARDLTHDAVTGALVLNSAGDAYDSTISVPTAAYEITIVRQEDTAPATVMPYRGTINSASVTIMDTTFAAYAARLTITFKETDGSSDFDYEYTYTITERKNLVLIGGVLTDIGWRESMVDQGYRYLDGGVKKQAMVLDENGEKRPVNTPILLNGSGAKLALGGNPVVGLYQAHPTANWSSLNL